jgi:predicted nucleic acid-binding protein
MTRIFVFDTNVLLSAALSRNSASYAAFRKAIQHDYIVYS